MYQVLDKDTTVSEILPYLPKAKRGFITKSNRAEIVNCILYKLKNWLSMAYASGYKSIFKSSSQL